MKKFINFPVSLACLAGKSIANPITFIVLGCFVSYKATEKCPHPEVFGKPCIFMTTLSLLCIFYLLAIFFAFAVVKSEK